MTESDEEAPETEEGEEEEEREEEQGIRLGEHWNFYLLLFFSGLALICGHRMTSSCDFVHRNIQFSDGYDATSFCTPENNLTTIPDQTTCEAFFDQHACGFKMWSANISEKEQVCLSYNMYIPRYGWVIPSFDTFFSASEIFAVMANVAGSFAFFLMVFTLCFPVREQRTKGLAFLFFCAGTFQCMTFWILASNVCNVGFFQQYAPGVELPIDKVECSLAVGGHMDVTAAVLYFVCFCLARVAVPPPPIDHYREGEAEPDATTATLPTAGAAPPLYPVKPQAAS